MIKQRIHLIDALRGFAIILMVAFHFGINLVDWGFAEPTLVFNPTLRILQPIFAGVFILLSGMSSRFSRSNLRRGVIVLLCAYAVSIATFWIGMPIYFGILHFLGVAMTLYGLLQSTLDKLPKRLQPAIYIALFAVSSFFFPRAIEEETNLFLPFGLYGNRGADYFPLLPWLFLFLLGTWLGKLAVENKLPKWFYTFNMPILPIIGRHGLLIYLVHQPVLYGIFWLVA
ncbi:MAG: DUF1624 domain-containing protein [Oscillospiraceae bacterium]|nr:DUF1624 domain-containing protein [Oscillospiraceae bacterium]